MSDTRTRRTATTPATGTAAGLAIADDDVVAIAERLRLSATRLARQLRQQSDVGLTPSQLSALASIGNHGPLTLGELAERERVSAPSITRVVGKLEEAGLLSRHVDADDRRVQRVELTREGTRTLAEVRRRKDAWLAGQLRGLEHEQRAALAGALDALDALVRCTDAGTPGGGAPASRRLDDREARR